MSCSYYTTSRDACQPLLLGQVTDCGITIGFVCTVVYICLAVVLDVNSVSHCTFPEVGRVSTVIRAVNRVDFNHAVFLCVVVVVVVSHALII